MVNLMIEADNLRRMFKDHVAVAGISFSVQHGEIFGLPGVYTAIAAKGYVQSPGIAYDEACLVRHKECEYSDRKGNHVNGLEGFWGYLKRRLAAKGGITQEKLPLYLEEYIWRHNHRKETVETKKKQLLKLLEGVKRRG